MPESKSYRVGVGVDIIHFSAQPVQPTISRDAFVLNCEVLEMIVFRSHEVKEPKRCGEHLVPESVASIEILWWDGPS